MSSFVRTLASILVVFGFIATGCTVGEIRCERTREFDVDAELTKADVERLCEMQLGVLVDGDGCRLEDPYAPDEPVFYVPDCEDLCWARQQRFVEEYGTGTLGFPPDSVEPPNFEEAGDFGSSTDVGIRRAVSTCTTTANLDEPLPESGSIGRIRCSGVEMATCRDDAYH